MFGASFPVPRGGLPYDFVAPWPSQALGAPVGALPQAAVAAQFGGALMLHRDVGRKKAGLKDLKD